MGGCSIEPAPVRKRGTSADMLISSALVKAQRTALCGQCLSALLSQIILSEKYSSLKLWHYSTSQERRLTFKILRKTIDTGLMLFDTPEEYSGPILHCPVLARDKNLLDAAEFAFTAK